MPKTPQQQPSPRLRQHQSDRVREVTVQPEWFTPCSCHVAPTGAMQIGYPSSVVYHGTRLTGQPGDYLIRTADNQLFLLPKEVFWLMFDFQPTLPAISEPIPNHQQPATSR